MNQVTILDGASDVQPMEAAFASTLEHVGVNGFDTVFVDAINKIADTRRVYGFECNADGSTSKLICGWSPNAPLEAINREYVHKFRNSDPIYDVLTEKKQGWRFGLLRVSPKELGDTDYRKIYYDRFSITERVSFLQKLDNGNWLTLSVSSGDRGFSDAEIEGLTRFAMLSKPALARYVSTDPEETHRSFSYEELERRFEIACPSLTKRQRQVCARTMAGATAEAVGIDLGISKSTVLTFRRRAYERLGICSAYQLSGFVFN